MKRIDHADRQAHGAAALGADRALRAPLRALRVAIEGLHGGPESEFARRALSELRRAERAALDLVAACHERPRALSPASPRCSRASAQSSASRIVVAAT